MPGPKKKSPGFPGLGAILLAARTAKGLSLTEVHDSSGVDRAGLSLYERDLKIPSLPVLAKLATLYGVTLCALLPESAVPPVLPAAKSARKSKSQPPGSAGAV